MTAVPVLYGIDTGFGSGGGSGGGGGGVGGGGTSFLVTVDQTSGAVTLVGEPRFGGSLSSLAADPNTGTLYSVRGGTGVDNPSRLIAINPHTADAVSIGRSGVEFAPFNSFGSGRQNVTDLTFSPDGTSLLGIAGRGTQLGAFDAGTGAATKVGDTVCSGTRCSRGNALAYSDGDLHLIHSEFIFNETAKTFIQKIDPGTGDPIGSAQEVDYGDLYTGQFDGPNPGSSYRIGSLAVHPVSGEAFVTVLDGNPGDGAASNSILGTLDLDTGVVTGIENTGLKLEGLAFVDDSFLSVPPSDDISVTADNAFHFRSDRGPNLSGFGTGVFHGFGVDFVTPNPDDGVGGDLTTVVATQNGMAFEVPYGGQSEFPGEYFRLARYSDGASGHPDLTGAWELTVNNAGSSNSGVTVMTPGIGAAQAVGYVTDVSISSDGATPTVSWSHPDDLNDNVRIFITDLDEVAAGGGARIVHVESLDPTVTSFDIPAVLSSGESLALGGKYEIVVSRDLRRANDTLLSRSSTFAAFTPLDFDTGGLEVFIPTVDQGVFNFDIAVEQGFPVIIDPFVATGYDYAIGDGDPYFDSVMVLTDAFAPGTGTYELRIPDLDNPGGFFSETIAPGEAFSFSGFQALNGLAALGVPSFSILGIPTEAGLDPLDATAFLTQVEFVASGRFTGSMTPRLALVAQAPAPATAALFGASFAVFGFGVRARRRRASGLVVAFSGPGSGPDPGLGRGRPR